MLPADLSHDLQAMRSFFQSGATRSYAWRKQQLILLKQTVQEMEEEIAAALYADLKKSREESYGTETGVVLAELSTALRHLHRWMRPRAVLTNLVNLPSASRIYYDPLGVVLIMAPWNYPLQLSLAPLVSALAGGNCVVIKPSEMAPATAGIIEKIIGRIYRPEYVRVIQGEGALVTPSMLQSFRFDHIFFTGSTTVGRAIYQLAAKDLVPVTLELGGKSPAIVEADADLETAARRIILGKFTNAGQTCIAPDYLLLHADIKENFIGAFRKTLRQFYGDDPAESHDYGRIISEKRFDALVKLLSQGRVIEGGRHDRASLYIAPTLLDEVSLRQPLMKEEIFGPLLPVLTYRTMEEALEIIRQNPDPLAFYLFTKDTVRQKLWMEKCPFGGGCINNTVWHFVNYHLPFGGIGSSGIGAYHGKYGFGTFTHAKPVMRTPSYIDPAIKYPPFKGKLKWFKRFFR